MKRRGPGVWWVRCAAVSVVLGATASVVVAYVGALWSTERDVFGYANDDRYMLRTHNPWWDVVTVIGGGESNAELVGYIRGVRSWDGSGIAALVRMGSAGGQWPREVVMIGWPARCFWGVRGGIEGGRIDSLVEVPGWLKSLSSPSYPLPTAVWWPGMMANVGVFGGTVMVMLASVRGARALRGRRRQAKGRCAACGYDLKGQSGVCPECGAGPVPQSAP